MINTKIDGYDPSVNFFSTSTNDNSLTIAIASKNDQQYLDRKNTHGKTIVVLKDILTHTQAGTINSPHNVYAVASNIMAGYDNKMGLFKRFIERIVRLIKVTERLKIQQLVQEIFTASEKLKAETNAPSQQPQNISDQGPKSVSPPKEQAHQEQSPAQTAITPLRPAAPSPINTPSNRRFKTKALDPNSPFGKLAASIGHQLESGHERHEENADASEAPTSPSVISKAAVPASPEPLQDDTANALKSRAAKPRAGRRLPTSAIKALEAAGKAYQDPKLNNVEPPKFDLNLAQEPLVIQVPTPIEQAAEPVVVPVVVNEPAPTPEPVVVPVVVNEPAPTPEAAPAIAPAPAPIKKPMTPSEILRAQKNDPNFKAPVHQPALTRSLIVPNVEPQHKIERPKSAPNFKAAGKTLTGMPAMTSMVNKHLSSYGFQVKSLKDPLWKNGQAFCALAETFDKGLYPKHFDATGQILTSPEAALAEAFKSFDAQNIPHFLDVEDRDGYDDKSIYTYLGQIAQKLK